MWDIVLDGNGGASPQMPLILRPMNKHARLMGWGDHWYRGLAPTFGEIEPFV
jgi:hypothetical protein